MIPGKRCPICGYPMQFRYKSAYGLRLHICTNEPEVCSFMTNEYKAGKLSILKCDQCRDGYLIAKPGKDGSYFLGCTNYKKDGTGCGKIIWKQQYLDLAELESDPQSEPRPQPKHPPTPSKTILREEPKFEARTKQFTNKLSYKGGDLGDIVYTIFLCLSHVSEKHYYGVSTLMDVLRGAQSKKLLSAGLDSVAEYGMLKYLSRDDLGVILDWLIENKFILKTKGQYPVLHPTYISMHFDESVTAGMLKKLHAYLVEEKA